MPLYHCIARMRLFVNNLVADVKRHNASRLLHGWPPTCITDRLRETSYVTNTPLTSYLLALQIFKIFFIYNLSANPVPVR